MNGPSKRSKHVTQNYAVVCDNDMRKNRDLKQKQPIWKSRPALSNRKNAPAGRRIYLTAC
ncbi:hypothetical protein AGR3A_Cc10116 [Agrobacterium tomkonis CFBP 6623]|uniref:Uncharacterized protein n=1 Tax=Agrobacterium tomkonis CFBP 6623 TaxID=1183432 RepID=A0A1S7NKZ7_9HYPH|nr:hypothetical protein AGR3A_Cc10116 [Agrobacterium tomkonis CFBP 6623]